MKKKGIIYMIVGILLFGLAIWLNGVDNQVADELRNKNMPMQAQPTLEEPMAPVQELPTLEEPMASLLYEGATNV